MPPKNTSFDYGKNVHYYSFIKFGIVKNPEDFDYFYSKNSIYPVPKGHTSENGIKAIWGTQIKSFPIFLGMVHSDLIPYCLLVPYTTNYDGDTCCECQFHFPPVKMEEETEDDFLCDFVFSSIPTLELLVGTKNKFKTYEQTVHWLELKAFAIAVALCLYSRFRFLEDPLTSNLESGRIDTWLYNFIWAVTEFYEATWGLVQYAESLLKEKLDSYPFSSARELFQEIIRAEFDGDFKFCLEKYKEIPGKEVRKKLNKLYRQQQRNGGFQNEKQIKEWHKLQKIYDKQNKWFKTLLDVCYAVPDSHLKSYTIRNKLREIHMKTDNVARLLQQADCNPSFKRYQALRHAWRRGRIEY